MKGKEYPTKGSTEVENDVWIGFNSTIMQVQKLEMEQ